MQSLPDYISFKEFPGIPFKECFTAASDALLQAIAGLLRYNPGTRITAVQVFHLSAQLPQGEK